MFTFLSRFYDENPTILLVMCGLMLLLWFYFVFSEFFKVFTEQNRFDITLAPKKSKSSKILKESLCKRIAWINGKRESSMNEVQFPLIIYVIIIFILGSTKSRL